MAKRTNLSEGKKAAAGRKLKVAIVVSQWNEEITESLFKGAKDTLEKAGCLEKNIIRLDVPGSYELTSAADLALRTLSIDAVICLGCVVQGETRHFEFICQAVAQGLTDVSLKHEMPVIFGVLTTNDWQQALDRAGGRHGNKGVEAADTALSMIKLFKEAKRAGKKSR